MGLCTLFEIKVYRYIHWYGVSSTGIGVRLGALAEA